MRQADAVIQSHYGIDPDTLSDEQWCKLYADYLFINKLNHLNLKAAIMAAASEIFGNGSNDNTMDS